MRLVIAVAVFAACNSSSPPPSNTPPSREDRSRESFCRTDGDVTLSDAGTLRCRELPIEVVFPSGAKVTRTTSEVMTLFHASPDGDVYAVAVVPALIRVDGTLLEAMIADITRKLVSGAVMVKDRDPRLDGATLATALSFTAPLGKRGVARAYLAHAFLIAIVAASPRPEPVQAFLASLRVRPLATGTARVELVGTSFEAPASAWSMRDHERQGLVAGALFLPSHAASMFVVTMDFERSCASASADDFVRVATPLLPHVNYERARHGELSIYSEQETDADRSVAFLICLGKKIVQVSLSAPRSTSFAELRRELDPIAGSLKLR